MQVKTAKNNNYPVVGGCGKFMVKLVMMEKCTDVKPGTEYLRFFARSQLITKKEW